MNVVDKIKSTEIVSMLVSSTLANEILGELIENNANFIQDKNKEVEYANEIIGSKDIILIEKVVDDGEKWCFETLDFDPVIDTELMIIDKNVSDLVNFNNIEADDIEVIDLSYYDEEICDNYCECTCCKCKVK